MKTICIALGTGAICAALGLCAGMHTRSFDRQMVEKCRRTVEFFEQQPAEIRERAENIRKKTPALDVEWKIIRAIAGVEVR